MLYDTIETKLMENERLLEMGPRHYECALMEIKRLRAEVERLKRILGRIVEGDGDSTTTIRAGTDAFAAAREYLRREAHPAAVHCDNCGCDWLDNGLNPIGCPYCELRQETERRLEGNQRAAQEYVEDMRDVLKEAAQICKEK